MKYIQEDFEFYQTKDGKVGVDKVIITTSKSGKAFNDGTANGGDTSKAVKRVPFQKMSQDDKDLAKAAYKALKQNGSIDDVDKKFKTSPRPDVVMKSDGAHADIYYDSNKDGEPDEKDVRIAASRKRTAYQRKHGLTESCDPEVREVVVNIREIAYDYYKAHKDEGDGVWDAYVALANAVDYFIKEDENSNYSYQRALNKLDDAIDGFAEFDEDFAEELWEEAAELHQIAEHQTESKTRSLFRTLLKESDDGDSWLAHLENADWPDDNLENDIQKGVGSNYKVWYANKDGFCIAKKEDIDPKTGKLRLGGLYVAYHRDANSPHSPIFYGYACIRSKATFAVALCDAGSFDCEDDTTDDVLRTTEEGFDKADKYLMKRDKVGRAAGHKKRGWLSYRKPLYPDRDWDE